MFDPWWKRACSRGWRRCRPALSSPRLWTRWTRPWCRATSSWRCCGHRPGSARTSRHGCGRRWSRSAWPTATVGDGPARCAGGSVADWAPGEIAAALTWTHRTADWELGLADVVVRHLPDVFAALSAGRIDRGKAVVFAQHLDPAHGLTPAQTAGDPGPAAAGRAATDHQPAPRPALAGPARDRPRLGPPPLRPGGARTDGDRGARRRRHGLGHRVRAARRRGGGGVRPGGPAGGSGQAGRAPRSGRADRRGRVPRAAGRTVPWPVRGPDHRRAAPRTSPRGPT